MDHNLLSLLPSLQPQVKSDFGGKKFSIGESEFFTLDWIGLFSLANETVLIPQNDWKINGISLWHHLRSREGNFYKKKNKLFLGKRMIPIYTSLSSVARATQTNSQNPLEDGFHILQPKVSSTQLIWLEGTTKQQGFLQTWQLCPGCDHTSGKKAVLVLSPGCAEAQKINVSFFIPTQPFSIESQIFSLLKPIA